MHRQRLETLAEFLEGFLPTAERQFDLGHWFWKMHCGYSGCAVGWACTIPVFNLQGLVLSGSGDYSATYNRPHFSGESGDHAVKLFFDLDEEQLFILFSSITYPGNECHDPEAVAQRIRRLLAGETPYQIKSAHMLHWEPKSPMQPDVPVEATTVCLVS